MQKNILKHSFMVKSLSKLAIEGYFLNLIKVIYKNPTANIILNGERLNSSLLSSRTRKSYTQGKGVHTCHFQMAPCWLSTHLSWLVSLILIPNMNIKVLSLTLYSFLHISALGSFIYFRNFQSSLLSITYPKVYQIPALGSFIVISNVTCLKLYSSFICKSSFLDFL